MKPFKKYAGRRGWTLIEILIVCVIMGIMATAMFGVLRGGIAMWRAVQTVTNDEDVRIFFDRFRRDMQKIIRFSLLESEGERERLSVPVMVTREVADTADFVREIAMLTYRFNKLSRSIVREVSSFEQVADAQVGSARAVLTGVERVRFRYYTRSLDGKSVVSKETLELNELPCFVQVELIRKIDEKWETVTETFDVPAENYGNKRKR